MGKGIGKLGRRGKIGMAVLVAVMFIGVASATLLEYYGRIETTATVSQSVLLDGEDINGMPIYEAFEVTGGDTIWTKHTLQNDATVEAPIQFTTTGAGDEVTIYYYLLELQTQGSATADWSGGGHTSGVPAHLKTTGTAGPNEARVHIDMPAGTELSDIEEISWWEYLVVGYPPHVDIIIETSTGTDGLVFEYAYNGHTGDTQPTYGALTSPPWYQTFNDDGEGPAVVDDSALGWLSSGPPGGPGIIEGTLAEWKAGTVDPSVDGTTTVTALEIEIDNWMINTEAYVDDIQIKGNLDPITNFLLSPLTMYGLNIVYVFNVATIPETYNYEITIEPTT